MIGDKERGGEAVNGKNKQGAEGINRTNRGQRDRNSKYFLLLAIFANEETLQRHFIKCQCLHSKLETFYTFFHVKYK